MLVVEVPDGESAEALEHSLVSEIGDDLGLTIAVRPIVDDPGRAPDGAPWAVSLYGADRPGIVHAVTQKLADYGANIVDLSTRVIGRGPEHGYVLLMELSLPANADSDQLNDELVALAEDLGVEIHFRPDDAEIL
jgi:glycine cleavage system transcriptional repressor